MLNSNIFVNLAG